jgi:hypothetical protein
MSRSLPQLYLRRVVSFKVVSACAAGLVHARHACTIVADPDAAITAVVTGAGVPQHRVKTSTRRKQAAYVVYIGSYSMQSVGAAVLVVVGLSHMHDQSRSVQGRCSWRMSHESSPQSPPRIAFDYSRLYGIQHAGAEALTTCCVMSRRRHVVILGRTSPGRWTLQEALQQHCGGR